MIQKGKVFENIVEEGENGLKTFFPFYNVFFHIKDRNYHFSRYNTFDRMSANVFNMDGSVFVPNFLTG